MKTKYIIYLLICVLGFSSCGDSDKPEPTPTRTVLVYMVASNLGSYLNTNIDHMIEVATEKNLNGGNLLVYYSWYDKTEKTLNGELYQIKEGKGGVVTKHFIRDYNGQSALDVTAMRGIINDVFTEFPADSYGMIFSSHATAWFPSNYKNMLRSYGEENGKNMEIPDLAEALKGLPLEFLAFDACSMGAIECAYELRNCADYYISSTSEIMGTGFPFKEMLPYFFTTTPDYENIVNSFHNYYLGYSNPYGSLSVVKTEGLEELTAISKEILSAAGVEGMYALNPSREFQLLSNISGNPALYDFADVMSALATDAQKTRLNQALARTVVNKSITDEIYCSGASNRFVTVSSYSGLTIYPLRQSFTTLNDWYLSKLSWTKTVY
ncbi:clostripain-related cysteine peptidase [Parabacteroides sp. PF5-6]|uniref:clostripain-related cysteine peptidase n=1 Tax=Parabacteroides sp. PF5-6 TaxID=1742403 RepID=UPI0024049146|nr:clostripain-related cysteine peptidase [Parabacteroides sp. PF5-6]MDF9830596.1 hypothetical protein [Parabacteroides sp. PF5-6]